MNNFAFSPSNGQEHCGESAVGFSEGNYRDQRRALKTGSGPKQVSFSCLAIGLEGRLFSKKIMTDEAVIVGPDLKWSTVSGKNTRIFFFEIFPAERFAVRRCGPIRPVLPRGIFAEPPVGGSPTFFMPGTADFCNQRAFSVSDLLENALNHLML